MTRRAILPKLETFEVTTEDVEAIRVATIAKRSKDERDDSDSTRTPLWLASHLYETHGLFDLDPCSNPLSHIQARWSFSLEKGLDGLKLPWRGSVFKNNPFSRPLPWQLKANYELSLGRCTELVELCKCDPSTEAWSVITAPIARGWITVEQTFGDVNVIGHGPMRIGAASVTQKWWTPDLWLFDARLQYEEDETIVAKRVAKYAVDVAAGKKPKGRADGKSSNNFCSAIIHHRFDLPPLKLEKYATLWRRGG